MLLYIFAACGFFYPRATFEWLVALIVCTSAAIYLANGSMGAFNLWFIGCYILIMGFFSLFHKPAKSART